MRTLIFRVLALLICGAAAFAIFVTIRDGITESDLQVGSVALLVGGIIVLPSIALYAVAGATVATRFLGWGLRIWQSIEALPEKLLRRHVEMPDSPPKPTPLPPSDSLDA